MAKRCIAQCMLIETQMAWIVMLQLCD